MFIVLLKFAENRDQGGPYLDGHNEWLKRGSADGVFLLADRLQPNQGGAILAHATTLSELQDRVRTDPSAAGGVVGAEILEVMPSKTNERLGFLLS